MIESSNEMVPEKSIGFVAIMGISESYRFAHVVKKSPLSSDDWAVSWINTGIPKDSERAFEPPLNGYLLDVRMIFSSVIESPSWPLILSSCNNWYQAVPESTNIPDRSPISRVAFAS
jgi:hypothetical protein